VKLSGALSMLAWFLVIIFGRFIAYDWFYCEKETTTPGSLMYVLQECDSALAFRGREEAPAEMSPRGRSAGRRLLPRRPRRRRRARSTRSW
jgi:hypothetical protein